MLGIDNMRGLRRLKYADGAPIEKIMRRENLRYGTARETLRSNLTKFTYLKIAVYLPVTVSIQRTLKGRIKEDIIKGEVPDKIENAAVRA